MTDLLKKVLIITYYWPPGGGAGVQRWVKFSKYLENFGFEPIVITVNPEKASYPLTDYSLEDEVKTIKVIRTETFEPFRFYKKLLGKKEIPYAGFANETQPGILEKISRYIRGNFFIPDARKGWNRFVLPVARKLITEYNIKNLVTTSPPHSTQLIGLKLKSEFDLNWIADLRDPWTDIYYYNLMYHTPVAATYDKKLESRVLNGADHVVAVSHSIKKLFLQKLENSREGKIHVIPNGYDESDFENRQSSRNSTFIITYTGTIADNYHIENFLNAAARLRSENIAFRFVGRVSDKYKDLIRSLGLENRTTYIDHVRHQEAIKHMLSSDLLLLAIPDVADNEGILTGKLFEYLASGKKIIGIGPEQGDAAKIISACKAGQMFDYEENATVESFLIEACRDWEAGLDSYNENRCQEFSRKALTVVMAKLFV